MSKEKTMRLLRFITVIASLFVAACQCDFGNGACSDSCQKCSSLSCSDCERACDSIPTVGRETGCAEEIERLTQCAADNGLVSSRTFLVNGSWVQRPGAARDIGIGANGAVWLIGNDAVTGGYAVHKWVNTAWVATGGAGGTNITVSDDGSPWLTTSSFQVFRRHGQ